MAGFFLWSVLTSKWTYIVIAILLGLICGVLIWLGGYENLSLYIAGGSAVQSWSWRYEWMQKVGVGAGITSIILILLVIGFQFIFGGGGDDDSGDYYGDEVLDYYPQPPGFQSQYAFPARQPTSYYPPQSYPPQYYQQ